MNIYLISANSYHIINNIVKKILPDSNYETINYNNSSLDDIIDESCCSSLFGDEKYLLINNADFFGKNKLLEKDEKKLIKYLENPNPHTHLIFTTLNGIDKRKKIVKIINDKYKIEIVEPWDKRTMRNEATKYLNSFSYKIEYDTLTYILSNIHNNIDILYNELDKIMMFYQKGCQIKYEDIKEILVPEKSDNSWDFINKVINKDLKGSIKALQDLAIYKVESVTLISLLSREYHILYFMKNLKKLNITIEYLAKEYNLRDWQIDNIYNNSLKYQNNELINNIKLLSEIDLKIKNGTYNKDTILYSFLLQVCI